MYVIQDSELVEKLNQLAQQENRSVEDVLRFKYSDVNLDCAIIAIAERLEIKRIATLDHLDFAMVRPKHCDYVEIYPWV